MKALTQAVLKEMKEGQIAKKRHEPLCAVQISFHHTKFIDEVVEQLEPIVGLFVRYDNTLFQICENRNEAQLVANTINSIVHKANHILLKTPFEPTFRLSRKMPQNLLLTLFVIFQFFSVLWACRRNS